VQNQTQGTLKLKGAKLFTSKNVGDNNVQSFVNLKRNSDINWKIRPKKLHKSSKEQTLTLQKKNSNIEKAQYQIKRTSENKLKSFKKTPTKMGKETQMEHQNSSLWGCSQKKKTKLERNFFGGKK
jgi:hypothetical protein